jgi:hypothetical protein
MTRPLGKRGSRGDAAFRTRNTRYATRRIGLSKGMGHSDIQAICATKPKCTNELSKENYALRIVRSNLEHCRRTQTAAGKNRSKSTRQYFISKGRRRYAKTRYQASKFLFLRRRPDLPTSSCHNCLRLTERHSGPRFAREWQRRFHRQFVCPGNQHY